MDLLNKLLTNSNLSSDSMNFLSMTFVSQMMNDSENTLQFYKNQQNEAKKDKKLHKL